MIKRSDFRGWTLVAGQYWLEYVSRRHLPCALVLSRRHGREDIADVLIGASCVGAFGLLCWLVLWM